MQNYKYFIFLIYLLLLPATFYLLLLKIKQNAYRVYFEFKS